MKKVAILQSNYIPWKGYFDLINKVDEFILYDDVQYTRRDWRNRNKIKTPNGSIWLTVPVNAKGKFEQKINETKVNENSWAEKHWKSIEFNYKKSKYFSSLAENIKELYENSSELEYLSEINYMFIKKICELLEIKTKITWSSDYNLIDGRSERLLDLCLQARATTYLSGPAAKDYLDVELFNSNGISVEWMSYSGYPEYLQLYPPFEHSVTILDLLFNVGTEEARDYMLLQSEETMRQSISK
jgi:hypothetical protein